MHTMIDVSPPPVSQRPSWSRATCSVIACAALSFGLTGAAAAASASDRSPIPVFEATSLTGRTIHWDDLHGQSTVLIVTPGRDASASTRAWAKALREAFQGGVDDSARQARVFVLDAQGRVMREVDGDPTPERLDQLQAAVRSQP